MAWGLLVIAALFEVGWAVGLKLSDGFTKLIPTAFTIITFILGTAYAVWTGIGAAGTVIVGILFLGEPRDIVRLLCLVLIVAGVVGLKLAS